MSKARVVAAAMTAGVVMLAAPAAVATPPVLSFEDEWDDEFVDEELCEQGPITFKEQGHIFSRVFFTKDGSLDKDTIHLRATTVWSSEFVEATEHWAWNGTYDAETDTVTERGNQWNVHVVGDGVVLSNSGLLKFGFGEEGPEIIKSAGPKDVNNFEPPFAICDVLFP